MSRLPIPALCLTLLVALTAGCSSGDSLNRVEVRGVVTLNSQPLKEGAISFFPVDNGPVVGAMIKDGEFHVTRKTGPVVGEYRVEIDCAAPTGKSTTDFDGKAREEYASIIPTKYNRQSTLQVKLDSATVNRPEFHLVSDMK